MTVAAAYLQAGGTPVEHAGMPSAWVTAPALVDAPPVQWLSIVSVPDPLSGAGLVVGGVANTTRIWSAGGGACEECLSGLLHELEPAALRGPRAVVAGGLVALLAQRRILGLAPTVEGLALAEVGTLRVLPVPPCRHRPPELGAALLSAVVAHLISVWPEEGCGVLLAGEGGIRMVPLSNAQARHHARDPADFPQDARRAFVFEPRDWLGVLRSADASGERVLAVFHSHPDGPARFSTEDRRLAAPDGIPLLPGVAHLVVALRAGHPTGAAWALWKDGDFVEFSCPLPEQGLENQGVGDALSPEPAPP
jgi:proteasome lid subunit RPN8/RPN11